MSKRFQNNHCEKSLWTAPEFDWKPVWNKKWKQSSTGHNSHPNYFGVKCGKVNTTTKRNLLWHLDRFQSPFSPSIHQKIRQSFYNFDIVSKRADEVVNIIDTWKATTMKFSHHCPKLNSVMFCQTKLFNIVYITNPELYMCNIIIGTDTLRKVKLKPDTRSIRWHTFYHARRNLYPALALPV